MSVNLVSHDASDLKVVNAARVSYNSHHDELTDADVGLIAAMIREGHGSVFEHSTFTFRVQAPIAVVREWQRHRIGHSYNEVSGRYVKMEPVWETPQPREQKGKSMGYEYVDMEPNVTDEVKKIIRQGYTDSWEAYERMMACGVAKEVARYVLPLGICTKFYWTCNARSLMNFLELRTAPEAMREIRTRALEAEDHFTAIMPITSDAWRAYKKKAP